nr:MAG TPA: hypothetical protein [Caudoviricetes sp.]
MRKFIALCYLFIFDNSIISNDLNRYLRDYQQDLSQPTSYLSFTFTATASSLYR